MKRIGPFLFLFLFTLPAWAGVEVKATLEPETIGIDETATFTIEVHGDGFSSLSFRPDFEMDNLETLGNASRYEDMTFSNGSLSRTLRLSWQVRPLGLGKARVRAIVVHLDDREVPLPATEIKVQQEPTGQVQRLPHGARDEEDPFQRFFGRMPNPWRREPQQPDLFLRAEVQPARPVVGQQVLYTIYLYTRENIAGIVPTGIPTFRGFWVRDIPLPQQLPTEMVDLDGRRYGRVPLLKKALFPLRPGAYRLEPAAVDLTVERYDRSFFFGPAVARPEGVRLQTAPQTVDVQPLPPAPPGFGGAVGQISLSAQLEPKQVRLGEAATLTVRVSGVGNLQGIREPRLDAPPGLTLLPPQQEGKDDLNGSAVRGTRIWRYAVVPGRAGRFTLGSPRITYFDPAERRYEVATTPDLALTARAPPPAAAAGPAAGALAARAAGLPGRRWSPVLPWLLALPWGLVLVAALVRQRSARNGEIPGGAHGEAIHCLEEALRQAAAEERPRQMALRIEEAWRELLHRRWGVPRETPPSRWRELLAGQGVEEEALGELGLLIEDLQYLRFAPQLSTTDALRADALARCRRLVRRLS
ncbi:MAG TPA: BatD family protein [Thermoanaerobaculia bacterium]|nr:BatD family protein [Thermoanaerobaculia bacterium]